MCALILPRRILITLLLALTLGGCATLSSESAPSPPPATEIDPWEDFNRSVYAFNKGVDSAIIRPVAVTYDRLTPQTAKQGIENFFTNLSSPWVSTQLLLQGRFRDGSEQMGRFLINSIYGVGGFWDVADQNNLPEHETDLGATLATWGWKNSNFLMLPLLGPSTVRDGVGQITTIMVDPLDQAVRDRAGAGVTVLNVVQIRAGLLSLDETVAGSYDEYAFIRDGWLQRREYQLFGEDAALPDYDEFLEEDVETYDP